MDRPALAKLLEDVRARKIDVIVVYKVDRLTRSLADFAKVVELFDEHDVSFISVTQAFNTTTSMGRLRHKGQIHDGLHSAIIDLETWDRVLGASRVARAFLVYVLPPLPRCSGWASSSLISPNRISLPR